MKRKIISRVFYLINIFFLNIFFINNSVDSYSFPRYEYEFKRARVYSVSLLILAVPKASTRRNVTQS